MNCTVFFSAAQLILRGLAACLAPPRKKAFYTALPVRKMDHQTYHPFLGPHSIAQLPSIQMFTEHVSIVCKEIIKIGTVYNKYQHYCTAKTIQNSSIVFLNIVDNVWQHCWLGSFFGYSPAQLSRRTKVCNATTNLSRFSVWMSCRGATSAY